MEQIVKTMPFETHLSVEWMSWSYCVNNVVASVQVMTFMTDDDPADFIILRNENPVLHTSSNIEFIFE